MGAQSYRLTAQEVDAYRANGFVIPKFRLSSEGVASLQTALDALIADNPDVPQESLMSAHVVHARAGSVRGQAAFLELALDPQILDLVEQVIGPDIIVWGCHVFCKPGTTGRTVPWHQDGQYWPIRPLATCSVWLALDHVDRENGCMRVIPGSHRDRAVRRHHQNEGEDLALVQELDADQFDECAAVDIELAPGQVSLHDVYTIHGSAPNTSGRRRAGVALRYMPATSLFDRTLLRRNDDDPRRAKFTERPIWLARGVDRHGGNDFVVGHA